jgi:antitoxin (DNA-binding transcriptional repressor) of toxin-antitoxin stability system
MKTVDAGQFAANVSQYLQASQAETIVVTQGGKPCAVVHGVDYDDEQMRLINSQEFWSMIQERRGQSAIPWDVAKQRLNSLDQ